MTKNKLLEIIVSICAWMNGAIDYNDAKFLPIAEIMELTKIANRINKDVAQ